MLTASNAGPIPRLSWFQVYTIDAPLRLSATPPIGRSARPLNPGLAWTAASRLSLLGCSAPHRAALHTSGALAPLPSKPERTQLAWMGCPQGSCTTRCPSVTCPEQPPHVVLGRGRSLVSPLVTRCWGCPSVRFQLGRLLTTEVPLLSGFLLWFSCSLSGAGGCLLPRGGAEVVRCGLPELPESFVTSGVLRLDEDLLRRGDPGDWHRPPSRSRMSPPEFPCLVVFVDRCA